MTFTQQAAASFSFKITPIYKYSICGCMVTVNLLQRDLETYGHKVFLIRTFSKSGERGPYLLFFQKFTIHHIPKALLKHPKNMEKGFVISPLLLPLA